MYSIDCTNALMPVIKLHTRVHVIYLCSSHMFLVLVHWMVENTPLRNILTIQRLKQQQSYDTSSLFPQYFKNKNVVFLRSLYNSLEISGRQGRCQALVKRWSLRVWGILLYQVVTLA